MATTEEIPMIRRNLTAPSLVAALALVGCSGSSTTGPDSTPPELPPATSMSMDFSLFEDEAARLDHAAGDSQDNFLNAIVRVGVLNSVMIHAFTPPAVAFATAVNTDPIKQEDDTWLWSYSWSDSEGREVEIVLRANVDAEMNVVDWELRVSDSDAEPPLEDFVWFTGESSTVDDSGYWLFYDLEQAGTMRGGGSVPVVRLDWEHGDAEHRELAVELVDPGHEDVGDSLIYAVNATIVSVQYHAAAEDYTADITWDAITGAGSLRWPDYNSGVRACWDTEANGFLDLVCP